MKRFLLSSFFFLALITGAAPAVHAQIGESEAVDPGAAPGSGTFTSVEPSAEAVAAVEESQKTAAQTAANDTPSEKYDKKPEDDAYGGIMIRIMSLFAWLLGAAMVTLNYAAYYTVVTMGAFVKNLSAIGLTWQILRDFGNIMLIFGFLAIGISTILNSEWYGGGKKMLPMLLVAAVFLNFSLFITEAIIDTGNLFATQFYKQINGGALPTTATLVPTGSLANYGISAKIMSQLGLTALYGEAAKTNANADKIFNGGNPWIIGFMGILLFIIAAFVMFSLAFILIARFIILIFLIILAPVGFAGLAVPQLAGTAKKWWDELFKQTITAPILFLMLY
ncbi:hypothetical protein EXS57_01890, partial [Candidatus Kaiserbacteria bacterium]|nr:hypothetical protein [Candidatus Kaiserbacteria bacterium]